MISIMERGCGDGAKGVSRHPAPLNSGRAILEDAPAELLLVRRPGSLIFASFLRYDNERARAAWAVVESRHAPMMRQLLGRAVSSLLPD